MKVISLVGFKGSGKDTAGQHLVENHGFIPFSFAESLKDTLATIFCWEREMLEGATNDSRNWRETVDEWWAAKLDIPGFTPRMAMQQVGTDLFRTHFHPDIWINNIERKITKLSEDSRVVLIDGRFPNELQLGRKLGAKVIRVRRGDDPAWWDLALCANKIQYPHFKDGVCTSSDEAYAQMCEIEHPSEWAWIGYPVDVTVENDGTIMDLRVQITNLSKTHDDPYFKAG